MNSSDRSETDRSRSLVPPNKLSETLNIFLPFRQQNRLRFRFHVFIFISFSSWSRLLFPLEFTRGEEENNEISLLIQFQFNSDENITVVQYTLLSSLPKLWFLTMRKVESIFHCSSSRRFFHFSPNLPFSRNDL